jgi:hypothetical protein
MHTAWVDNYAAWKTRVILTAKDEEEEDEEEEQEEQEEEIVDLTGVQHVVTYEDNTMPSPPTEAMEPEPSPEWSDAGPEEDAFDATSVDGPEPEDISEADLHEQVATRADQLLLPVAQGNQ